MAVARSAPTRRSPATLLAAVACFSCGVLYPCRSGTLFVSGPKLQLSSSGARAATARRGFKEDFESWRSTLSSDEKALLMKQAKNEYNKKFRKTDEFKQDLPEEKVKAFGTILGKFFDAEAEDYKKEIATRTPDYDGLKKKTSEGGMDFSLKNKILEVDRDGDRRYQFATQKIRAAQAKGEMFPQSSPMIETWVVKNDDEESHRTNEKVTEFLKKAKDDPSCPPDAKAYMEKWVQQGVPPMGTKFELDLPQVLVNQMHAMYDLYIYQAEEVHKNSTKEEWKAYQDKLPGAISETIKHLSDKYVAARDEVQKDSDNIKAFFRSQKDMPGKTKADVLEEIWAGSGFRPGHLMDRQQKVALLRESLGAGVDPDFAQSVLAAHDWDLQAAMNTLLGDAGGGASQTHPPRREPVDQEGYRAPMRTGYTDTLIAPISAAEERRQRLEREMEEARRQQELLAQAEARRLAAERAEQDQQARQVEQQRLEAERLALEKRRQRQREAAAAAEAEVKAAQAAQAASAESARAAAAASCQDAPAQPVVAPSLAAGALGHQPVVSPAPPAMAVPIAAETAAAPEVPAVTRQADEEKRVEVAPPPAKAVDAVVQACLALRKRYKDADPAGLTVCLQTLRTYINNLARNPFEPKYQRISCENSAFCKRVGAFEGATEVLLACGFQQEDNALAVGADFAKTKGSRLWDALAKIDVMIEQLKSSS